MKMHREEIRRWVSLYLLVLAGIVSFWVISNIEAVGEWFSTLLGYLAPFIAGAIIAYLLDIPCSALEKILFRCGGSRFVRKHARGMAILGTFVALAGIVTIMLLIVIPEVVASIQEFAALLPVYTANAIAIIEDIQNEEIILALGLQYELQAFVNELTVTQVFDLIGQTFTDTMLGFISGIFSAAGLIVQTLIAIVSAIYLLLDGGRSKQFIIEILTSFTNPKTVEVIFRYVGNANQYLKSFINCSVVDSVIIGLITLVGLMILQVSYAVVLSLIMGFANLVPFFGPIVGTLIISMLVIITDDVPTAIAVALFLFILQQIDGNIIRVKLFGDAFKISPFLVIFSITIGGAYYGVLGMVFAIPLVAVLKVILNDIMDYRKKIKAMENRL